MDNTTVSTTVITAEAVLFTLRCLQGQLCFMPPVNFDMGVCRACLCKVYTRYGKCYTFNGNKTALRKTKQGGMGNGLEIMLDIQQDEYLPIWRETNETSLEAGIRVQIHSQDEPPYIHQLGFGVSPGFQTFVSCQEQRLTYLPQPWGNCRSSSKEKFPGYDTYSISACRLLCETNEVIRVCNCRMVHMPGKALSNSLHARKALSNSAHPSVCICVSAQLQKTSGDTCPCETPCNLTRYGKELSMVKIPSKGSARYLSRKYDKTEDYIRDNFLVLDIFFEALNYETIEQKKAYDVAGLLGDIGGQMGLFIGASILTVLEILDYIYEVLYYHTLIGKTKQLSSAVPNHYALTSHLSLNRNPMTRGAIPKEHMPTKFCL
uniref:Acid sensing ion channel subunit family member 4 n=1 Tax=Periophthalmus magnuspinnatus TaxID=409849 RepID=A0A3B4B135_9GOBI